MLEKEGRRMRWDVANRQNLRKCGDGGEADVRVIEQWKRKISRRWGVEEKEGVKVWG